MKSNIVQSFRIIYLIGLIMLIISLFLDWYSFKIYNLSNEILVSWKYNILFEWTTPYPSVNALNNSFRPENISIPMIINLIEIIVIIFSGYFAISKDIEQTNSTNELSHFSYINGSLLLFVLFYLLIFPIIYLLPKNFYFPLIFIEEHELGIIYIYSIGAGYILHLLAFPLIFPYTIFFLQTINNFEKLDHSPEKIVRKIIKETQETLDLDKFIAQEELKCNDLTLNSGLGDNSILNAFIEEIDKK